MVFNTTFNNISVISWRSDLLVGETGVPGENHDLSQVTDKLLYRIGTPRYEWGLSSQLGDRQLEGCMESKPGLVVFACNETFQLGEIPVTFTHLKW